MREIAVSDITNAVKEMCIKSNIELPLDLETCVKAAVSKEDNAMGKAILNDLSRNLDAAREMQIPICQDTGMAVIFAEVGQEVHITGDFEAAINEGVRLGYLEGFLRCSVVEDPLDRKNTDDNTPAVIHTKLVPGDKLKLRVAPKGFGSENMSRIKMMNPSAAEQDVIDFVTETVLLAGSNPCPPVVLGIGIGGDFELCAYLAKKALCRNVAEKNRLPYYAALEEKILHAVNALAVGPQGFGGDTTALAVMIETYPTHIAGLPVAVNVGCHVTRHREIVL